MKKITLEVEDMVVCIYVNGVWGIEFCDEATHDTIVELGGKALVVPSRDGAMSLQYDEDCNDYDIFDGARDIYQNLCAEKVEKAIGTGFRKKHFTFYLREV